MVLRNPELHARNDGDVNNSRHFFTACRIRQAGLSFEAMFEEVPILIRNSHLVNALLCEVEEETPTETKYNFLDLSTR